jgi:hypothetical protein
LFRNSNTMFKMSGENSHPCLVLNFRGNGFSFSPFSMMLAVGLFYIIFVMLRNCPSVPSSFRAFIIKRCWIQLKAVSVSINVMMWFLFFILFMYYIAFIDLLMLYHPCIPGIKTTWSWFSF